LHINSLGYAGNRPEKIILSQGHDQLPKVYLSPISTEIINQALLNKILLIFSRGPLNLSPLIAALRVAKEENDVLICIPENSYDKLNKKYSNEFFSFYRDNGLFFYNTALWCSVSIKAKESKIVLEYVRKRPKHGSRYFKKDQEFYFEEKLSSGECNKWPRIICTPINKEISDKISGITDFSLENNSYNLPKFSPKYVIFESINERIYSSEPILSLIESMLEHDIYGIIHFSWPYPIGATKILEALSKIEKSNNGKIQSFHLGIRYCIELKDCTNSYLEKMSNEMGCGTSIQTNAALKNISIEGDNWDAYYPDTFDSYNNKIQIAVIKYNNLNFNQLKESDSTYDVLLNELRRDVNQSEENRLTFYLKSLLLFPPFIDSFSLPNEMKKNKMLSSGEYRYISLNEYFDNDTSNKLPVGAFKLLCSQMTRVKDFQNVLNNIETEAFVGKSTCILAYLFNKIIINKKEISIIIPEYSNITGIKKGIADRISNFLNCLSKNPNLCSTNIILDNYYSAYTINGEIITNEEGRLLVSKINYKRTEGLSTISFLITVNSIVENEPVQNKIQILVCDFNNLYEHINKYDLDETELILPGPIPFFYFEDEVPKASKGYDMLYRQFKKIIIFSYPGSDLRKCTNELETLDNLLKGPLSNPVARNDLSLSIKHNPKKFAVEALKNVDLSYNIQELELPDDNIIDSSFRDNQFKHESNADVEQAKALSDIWSKINRPSNNAPSKSQSIHYSDNPLHVEVKYLLDGRIQNIILNRTSYVRIITQDDSYLTLSENLKNGDKLAYINGEDRESLDNLFIRSFSESRDWTLEDVLEPFTCLYIFYNSICNYYNQHNQNLDDIYWLNPTQKNHIIKIIDLLLNKSMDEISFINKWNELLEESTVWNALISLPKTELLELRSLFRKNGLITVEKIFKLASKFNLNYNLSSFKQLISKLASGGRKYYFQDSGNLLAIGNLVENESIKINFSDLTLAGKEIRTVLELEGFSISRVLSDTDNPLNEMDMLIRKNMAICEVINVGKHPSS